MNQNVRLTMQKKLFSIIPDRAIRKAAKEAKDEALKIMWERTAEGVGTDGRRLGGYTHDYHRRKKKFLRGGGGRSMSRLRSRKTDKAAKKIKDYMHLTGELEKDTVGRVTAVSRSGTKIKAGFQLFVKARSRDKARGLQSTQGRNRHASYSKKAWKFFGLSTQGSRVKKEEDRIKRAFVNSLKQQVKNFGVAVR